MGAGHTQLKLSRASLGPSRRWKHSVASRKKKLDIHAFKLYIRSLYIVQFAGSQTRKIKQKEFIQMKDKVRFAVFSTCIFLMLSPYGFAQMTTGTLLGTVQDETGGVMPGVSVTLVNLDTGITRTVLTDDEGRYRATNLSLGNYELMAELVGFNTASEGV